MKPRLLAFLVASACTALQGLCAGQETPRVVWIVLAGGVRTDDLLAEDRFPRIRRLVSEGVSTTQVRVESHEPGVPVRVLLTGALPSPLPNPPTPWPAPTLSEVLRKERALPPDAVWLVSSGSRDARSLAFSSDPEYGEAFGPAVLAADLLLTPELVAMLREKRPPGSREAHSSSPLSDLFDSRHRIGISSRSLGTISDFLMEEAVSTPAGPGGSDARALRAARRILAEIDPVLLTIVLADASISARSHDDGLKALDVMDRELGALIDLIDGDPARAARTSIVLAVDHGRNEKLTGPALLADDGSRSITRTLLVCRGPAFRSGESLRSAVRQIDIAPTIARIFDLRLRSSDGRSWRQAFP